VGVSVCMCVHVCLCVCAHKGSTGCEWLRLFIYIYHAVYTLCPSSRKFGILKCIPT
jgi:hypothetical protein